MNFLILFLLYDLFGLIQCFKTVFQLKLKLFNTKNSRLDVIDERNFIILSSICNWLSTETLQSFIPKDKVINFIETFKAQESIQNIEFLYNNIWDDLESLALNETRSLKELLGNLS